MAGVFESVPPQSGLYPRLLEREAVANIVAGFRTAEGGQAMMACGTPNTLVGLLIAEATESTRTPVLVPSPRYLPGRYASGPRTPARLLLPRGLIG